jgi:DNA-directed RNA polymerase subunit RPC12/RpoP
MPIVAITIWTTNSCTQCGVELPKNADASKDTETELIYCPPCGADVEEFDYAHYRHLADMW